MSTLTTSLKSDIDRLWTEFWTGGITNPLTVIEQISFLMFSRLLDVTETRTEKREARTKKPGKHIFTEEGGARLESGDIVFARTGATTGKSYLLRTCPERAVFASYLIRVRPNRAQVDPRYLSWYFQTPDYWRQISSSASGTAQPGVNATKLKSLTVPTPPPAEQRRIADILDKADGIRRKRREAIVLADELLRSAFFDMFGDPVKNPKQLSRCTLADVLLVPLRNGLSPASSGRHESRVLTLSAITRGRFDQASVKVGMFANEPWADVRLDRGEFLICRGNGNRDLVGVGAFPNASNAEVVFPDTMIAARVDSSRIGRAYFSQLWGSGLVRRHIEASARTTNGTYKINQTAVEATPLLLPEMAKLVVFERFAERHSGTRIALNAARSESEKLFDALLHQMFDAEKMS